MSSNPRRSPMTRPDSCVLTLKTTNMVLRKGATFHSPTSPSSPESINFVPPPLPRRSQTNLDDVVDAHRRRVALTLGDIDKTLSASTGLEPSSTIKSFRDDSSPVPRGLLSPTLISKDMEVERRVLRPRPVRRTSRHHESDSGLGTSIASSNKGKHASAGTTDGRQEKAVVKATAITRSAASSTTDKVTGLSARATNRIYEHTLKPLLAETAFKDFHPVVLGCPGKIQAKQIVCLRDLEKTLLLTAPEVTKAAKLYLDFCLTTVRCIQATVAFLGETEQRRPKDVPYSGGYFIDLVEQIRYYAQQLAENKNKTKNNKSSDGDVMDDVNMYEPPPSSSPLLPLVSPTSSSSARTGINILCSSDEVKLHGGIAVNGRPAELVRVRNGEAISIATGKAVDLEDDLDSPRLKRSASQTLADEEEIMRSMARRKKNAPPEEYAPKKCREPGCLKEFKRPCDLTKHEKTHSRPWKCPVATCKYHEYGWPTEKEMDRHHNDKHSAAPPMYECWYKPCPYKSKRESNCKQHMEKAHGWHYVRTKTNGKKEDSKAGSVAHATPLDHNMPTPTSDQSSNYGVSTPPHDFSRVYNGIEFPAYVPNDQFNAINIPQELQLDYSPVDNATPSTDSGSVSGSVMLDPTNAYQNLNDDFTMYDDIYNANAQLPSPMQNNPFSKEMAQQFAAFSAAELSKAHPAPHISPIGQGNAMLFTPSSLAEVDEGFEDFPAHGHVGPDFCLFPPNVNAVGMVPDVVKQQVPYDSLFGEIPSVVAGYSQPTSQELLPDWRATADYQQGYSQQ